MRVLIVTVPLPTAQNPSTMAPLARQIASLRHLGVDIDLLEVKGAAKLKYLSALFAQRRYLDSIDLIHGHFGYCGWLARLQRRKPVVVSFMGDDLLGTPNANGHVNRLSRAVVRANRYVGGLVDAVIVKSAEMAAVLEPTQAHVVPNGVDLSTFQPMAGWQARKALGWPEGVRYILFPGNPGTPRKGFPLAEDVVRQAAPAVDKPLRLVPLHRVAPAEVPLYMNACDAMLMTSFIEGSPNVVKEAMACNLAVVSVPVGDVPELVDGVAGYVVCPRDAAAMATALVKRLRDDACPDGRAALERKGLDLTTVAKRVATIYSHVIDKNSK